MLTASPTCSTSNCRWSRKAMSIASAARHVPAAPALRCPSATGKRFRACARLSGPSASRCRWMRITPTTPMASPACPLSSRWQAVAQRHGGRWQKEWTAPGAAARQTSRPETRPGWRRQWQGEASRRKPAGPPGRHGPAEAPERPRFAELADGRHWLTTSPQGQTRLRQKKGRPDHLSGRPLFLRAGPRARARLARAGCLHLAWWCLTRRCGRVSSMPG